MNRRRERETFWQWRRSGMSWGEIAKLVGRDAGYVLRVATGNSSFGRPLRRGRR